MQPPYTRLFTVSTAALASREGGSTLTTALTWSWVSMPHFFTILGMYPIPNTLTNVELMEDKRIIERDLERQTEELLGQVCVVSEAVP